MAPKPSHCHLCTKQFSLLRRRYACGQCLETFCKKCTNLQVSFENKAYRLCSRCVMPRHPLERSFQSARTHGSLSCVMDDSDTDDDAHNPVVPLFHSSRSYFDDSGAASRQASRIKLELGLSSRGSPSTVVSIDDDDDVVKTRRGTRLLSTPEEEPHARSTTKNSIRPPMPSPHKQPSRLLLTPRQLTDVNAKRSAPQRRPS
ncbi:Aste57867_20047 [Aphanomyces stellatus]|uniref:Aste57867_20047 protein n=1 Tax=Aphanomyces stellatus TaxID=120398 RepID=A0A485LG03_9STRA|nr:hypothetical protein As57867_019981 [Aphanomyces stellatus]VFT96743.1 Aste57867_20047 [Aphanomyces stellatus]